MLLSSTEPQAQTISLPTGPSSFEGFGESFEATPSSGSFRAGYEFQLPPGRAGFSPQLAISYDSGRGNGPIGPGWGMSTMLVRRQSDKGIPLYGEQHPTGEPSVDRFINEAGEELVRIPSESTPESQRFRAKNEKEFRRYTYYPAEDYWLCESPEGLRYIMGQRLDGTDVGARIPSPNGASYCWHVGEAIDLNDNRIEFTYEKDGRQSYLSLIEWGAVGANRNENGVYTVNLLYTSNRPDPFVDYRPGFRLETNQRLSRVEVFGAGELSRAYRLDYQENATVSLLRSVTTIGDDDSTELPPMVYDYTDLTFRSSAIRQQLLGLNGARLLLPGLTSDQDQQAATIIDFNADSLPDFYASDYDTFPARDTFWENNGDGSYSRTVLTDDRAGIPVQTSRSFLRDMDGNGTADLIAEVSDASGDLRYNLNTGGAWQGTLQPISVPPNQQGILLQDIFLGPNVRPMDIDFDKDIDTLLTEEGLGSAVRLSVFFNQGSGHFNLANQVTQNVRGLIATFETGGSRLQVADINGDRLSDLLYLSNGAITWWPAMGYGQFDDSTSGYTLSNAPTLTDDELDRLEVIDLQSDGLADLVLLQGNRVDFWLNESGVRFSPKRSIVLSERYEPSSSTTSFQDMDGDGLVDLLVYTSEQPTPLYLPRGFHVFSFFQESVTPYLLESITTPLGGSTRIEYTSTAAEMITAVPAWTSFLPFSTSIVSAVVTTDGVQDYRTTYSYRDPYYDGDEKEFRGFEQVTQTDVGNGTQGAPSLITKMTFDVGRTTEALKGMLRESETSAENGDTFHRITNTLVTKTLLQGTQGIESSDVSFPFVSDVLTHHVEEPSEKPTVTAQKTFKWDDYGNNTEVFDHGRLDTGWDDERVIRLLYSSSRSANQQSWKLRFPLLETIQDQNNNFIARTEYFYDDETFSAVDSSRNIIRGLQTLVRVWTDPDDNNTIIDQSRMKYDTIGNPVTIIDPLATLDGSFNPVQNLGHYRSLEYDPNFRIYPIRETIYPANPQLGPDGGSIIVEVDYNFTIGKITDSFDPNGNQTTYAYDPLQRLTSIIKPGDTVNLPTTSFSYTLNNRTTGRPLNWIQTRQREVSGAPGTIDQQVVIDGLGRTIMNRAEGEVANQVVVSNYVLFNDRGQPWKQHNPFFETAPSLVYTEPSISDVPFLERHYDPLGRVTEIYHPLLSGETERLFARTTYEPLAEFRQDEEQTNEFSPFVGLGKRQVYDGLTDSEQKPRLRQLEELVRLTDEGEPSIQEASWITTYSYDLLNNLTEIVDAQNNTKLIEFDALSRMTFMNDPNRGHLTFLYDDLNLIQRTDAKGQVIRYSYDGANRPLTIDYIDEGSPYSLNRLYNSEVPPSRSNLADVTYFYDTPEINTPLGDGTTATAENAIGQVATIIDLSGEEHFSYDARGRTGYTTKMIPDPILGVPGYFTTAFKYDAADRMTSVIYPDGDRSGMAYNPRGLTERIIGGSSANAGNLPWIIGRIDYQPSGQIQRLETGDGAINTRLYDERLRMNTLRINNGSEALLDYRYHFDGVSNITAIDDLRSGATPALPNNQVFGYDDLYRLTRVTYPDLSNEGIDYRYNRIGNMVRQNSDIVHQDKGKSVTDLGTRLHGGGAGGDSNRMGRDAGDPPGPHALTSTDNGKDQRTIPYDDNGNMIDLDGMTLTWDFEDRLVAAENDQMLAEYRYDYTNRRISRKVTAKTDGAESFTTLYINKWFEVREHQQPVKYLWNGETRVARATGTLDDNADRIQRWRLKQGWNMISTAIEAPDLAQQLGIGTSSINAAFLWDPESQDYTTVTTDTPLPQGSVLRINVASAQIISARGSYTRMDSIPVEAPGDYLPAANLESIPLLPGLPLSTVNAWNLDGDIWQLAKPRRNNLPTPMLAAGSVSHLRTTARADYITPAAETQIQYYHQDHLGSSNLVTDADGSVFERAVNYPYGYIRDSLSIQGAVGRLNGKYGFTQKELDVESGLHYFEARFYAAGLGVFSTVDPISNTGGHFDRRLHMSYAYAANSPILYIDPSGEIIIIAPAVIYLAQVALGAYAIHSAASLGYDIGTEIGEGYNVWKRQQDGDPIALTLLSDGPAQKLGNVSETIIYETFSKIMGDKIGQQVDLGKTTGLGLLDIRYKNNKATNQILQEITGEFIGGSIGIFDGSILRDMLTPSDHMSDIFYRNLDDFMNTGFIREITPNIKGSQEFQQRMENQRIDEINRNINAIGNRS